MYEHPSFEFPHVCRSGAPARPGRRGPRPRVRDRPRRGDPHPAHRPSQVRPRRVALPLHAAGRGGGQGRERRRRRVPRGRIPRRSGSAARGRHVAVRAVVRRRHSGGCAQALPRRRGSRWRQARARPTRCHGAAGQRAAQLVRPQAGPRPGLRECRDDGRCHRQQLLRHGLRHGIQHLPHLGVADVRPPVRHRHQHRRCGRRPAVQGAGAGAF